MTKTDEIMALVEQYSDESTNFVLGQEHDYPLAEAELRSAIEQYGFDQYAKGIACAAQPKPEAVAWLCSTHGLHDDSYQARECNDCKPLALRDAQPDTVRLDWILDNCTIVGGGNGMGLSVWIPFDCEDVRTAIDSVLAAK